MSNRQIPNNPFIAPESQYRCAVADCLAPGVWSPMVNGSTWYCRAHAGLHEPTPRWEPEPGPYTAEQIAEAQLRLKAFTAGVPFEAPSDEWWHKLITRWRAGEQLLLVQTAMATQAWINAHRPHEWTPPDIEAIEERLAIQAEGA
jgi:hypothetical protein